MKIYVFGQIALAAYAPGGLRTAPKTQGHALPCHTIGIMQQQGLLYHAIRDSLHKLNQRAQLQPAAQTQALNGGGNLLSQISVCHALFQPNDAKKKERAPSAE